MSNEEAIKGLLNVKMQMCEETPFTEAVDLAVMALEKQIPEKPRLRKGCNWIYRCPRCTHLLYWTDEPKNHGEKNNCCERCGQAIDWAGV